MQTSQAVRIGRFLQFLFYVWHAPCNTVRYILCFCFLHNQIDKGDKLMKQSYTMGKLAMVVTPKTTNRKTGDMAQGWIIRNDMLPTEACKTGADSAICGNCPHKGKSCYVNVCQAPQVVYKSFKKGNYNGNMPDISDKPVRLGAYGDPAFIPYEKWLEVIRAGNGGNTGYTHQWRTCDNRFKNIVMASCDSEKDRLDAKRKGYRTFRVRREGEPLMKGEINCPADSIGIQCAKCLKCGGLFSKANKHDISIVVHGSRKNNF